MPKVMIVPKVTTARIVGLMPAVGFSRLLVWRVNFRAAATVASTRSLLHRSNHSRTMAAPRPVVPPGEQTAVRCRPAPSLQLDSCVGLKLVATSKPDYAPSILP